MTFFLRNNFLCLLSIFCGNILAAQSTASWFNKTIDRIELLDTAGISKELNEQLSSSETKSVNYYLAKIASTDFLLLSGKFPEAQISIRECRQLDSIWKIDSLKNMVEYMEGYYYYANDDYPIALKFLNSAALAFNNKAANLLQARCFYSRGLIFESLNYPDDAQKNFLVLLNYYSKRKIPKREAGILNNLGITSMEQKDSAHASAYFFRSLAIRDSMGDVAYVGQSYNNLGALMYNLKHYDLALEYYKKGYDYRVKGKAPETGIIESKINIGKTLHQTGKQKEAIVYLEEAFDACDGKTKFELKRLASAQLMELYFEIKDYKRAYEMQSTYYFIKDSLYGESKKEEIVKLSVQYNFENKQKQDSIRRVVQEIASENIQHEKDKRTNLILISLLIGLALAGFFVFSLYKSNQQKKKSNEIISSQRDILDKKQQEITESIQYAKYIQQALLPEPETLKKYLPEHFILYRPKDIVSGDFYWLDNSGEFGVGSSEKDKEISSSELRTNSELQTLNSKLLLAVADCTGHGVPGAFMSLLGKENLDKAAGNSKNPGTLLSLLNKSVKQSLKQNSAGHSSHDGMDIALISLEKNENGATIVFSSANRPLWIFRKKENSFLEIKPTKAAIGGFTPDDQPFAENKIEVVSGDTLYLFTDGYADQFGGLKHKKMTTKKFRELLVDVQAYSIKEQKEKLEIYFDSWKENLEQVDDILVIGIKI